LLLSGREVLTERCPRRRGGHVSAARTAGKGGASVLPRPKTSRFVSWGAPHGWSTTGRSRARCRTGSL